MIISFPEYKKQAKELAQRINDSVAIIRISQFPDGESLIKIPEETEGKDVYFYVSLNNPNNKLVNLLLAAHHINAKSVNLIAPYLCYMRQDKQFEKGQVVSARVLPELFGVFDKIITVDPHLHRIKNLNDIFKKGIRITSSPKIAEFIKNKYKDPIIIGPDEESFQWAKEVASEIGCEAHIFKKKRISSNKVIIDAEIENVGKKTLIIVDDIISTGHTMEEMIIDMKKCGARKIVCIAVHGIFADNAYKRLKKAGAQVITTNTVPNKSSKINIIELIAKEIKK